MKKMGIVAAFLVFLTTSLIFAQEIKPAICQVFIGSSESVGEIEVESGVIDANNRLDISVRNRIRNADVEIIKVVVKGNMTEQKGTKFDRSNINQTFTGSDISFRAGFNSSSILERSKRGVIRIQLNNIKKGAVVTITEVTVYADICEL
jgi:hypothetical protein